MIKKFLVYIFFKKEFSLFELVFVSNGIYLFETGKLTQLGIGVFVSFGVIFLILNAKYEIDHQNKY